MHTPLDSIIIEPKQKATHSIIFLHGLGADGNDFAPVAPILNLPVATRFIFPHAPVMPITINSGFPMRAWYDIVSLTIEQHMDERGISSSQKMLETLIDQEITQGIPSKNIIIAGFSQGAVMAYMTGLQYPQTLAGVMALSGYLPFLPGKLASLNPEKKSMPIFIAHGKQDLVVPYLLGQTAYDMLKKAEFNVSFHSYDIAHTVSEPEIKDINGWLNTTLG